MRGCFNDYCQTWQIWKLVHEQVHSASAISVINANANANADEWASSYDVLNWEIQAFGVDNQMVLDCSRCVLSVAYITEVLSVKLNWMPIFIACTANFKNVYKFYILYCIY